MAQFGKYPQNVGKFQLSKHLVGPGMPGTHFDVLINELVPLIERTS